MSNLCDYRISLYGSEKDCENAIEVLKKSASLEDIMLEQIIDGYDISGTMEKGYVVWLLDENNKDNLYVLSQNYNLRIDILSCYFEEEVFELYNIEQGETLGYAKGECKTQEEFMGCGDDDWFYYENDENNWYYENCEEVWTY